MFFDPEKKENGYNAGLFKALVVPRPIAWVTSMNDEGTVNLAPFSWYNAVCGEPPIVMISTEADRPREGVSRKDTERNIIEKGEFVVNVPTWELRDRMNLSSAPFPTEVSEVEKAGLTLVSSNTVAVPGIQEAPVRLECKLINVTRLPDEKDPMHVAVLFGQVAGIYIHDDVLKDGKVDYGKLDTIARLGGSDYARLLPEAVFEMGRPSLK